MTDPTPGRRRRKPVAAGSRAAIAGMSLTVGCGVLAALALSAPAERTTVQLDAGTPVTESAAVPVAPLVEVPPEPPPTTIVVITHYIPADGGTGSGTGPSRSLTPTQSPSHSSAGPSSGGAPTPVASAPASALAATSPAPAAAPKPTAPPVTSTKAS